ncbi:MAG: hypothetical protein B7Z37_05655 [Verrucomicrobia bacterium 12-59-8]|nr:MAG: hypothetical protein B7Z37_05655 [Verrucomicrobia bacterium 12-59-8]
MSRFWKLSINKKSCLSERHTKKLLDGPQSLSSSALILSLAAHIPPPLLARKLRAKVATARMKTNQASGMMEKK